MPKQVFITRLYAQHLFIFLQSTTDKNKNRYKIRKYAIDISHLILLMQRRMTKRRKQYEYHTNQYFSTNPTHMVRVSYASSMTQKPICEDLYLTRKDGKFVVHDPAETSECFSKSAEQRYTLPICSRHTQERHPVQRYPARKLFLSQKKTHPSQAKQPYNLGEAQHDDSKFVAKNPKKAFDLFYEAAEQGHASAQYNLGVMYFNGEFVIVQFNRNGSSGHLHGRLPWIRV
ncbi:MAG: hypothetical protein LBR91_00345 [Puniceicoccales bacterium]|jgi:hypothetical protein|nr:hypothetical protein [Puniceicoccales bacterium]